ncbi:murein biosynthesis integral membrane protein MurJ [Candidatus Riflebacteria bacterium]
MSSSLFKALRINIGLTTLSRVVGMIRQVVISSQLGLSVWADAYQVGFRLANLFRMLLGEGALGAAFIPVYTQLLHQEQQKDADLCFSIVFNYLFVILLLLVLWGCLFPAFFVDLTAVGLSGAAREKAIWMTRLMFPYLFFVGLAGLLMAVLNSHKHFTITAAQPIVWNLCIIFSPLLPINCSIAEKFACGVLLGGALQFLVQIPFLSKFKVKFQLCFEHRVPAFRQVLWLLGPVVLTSAISRINSLVDQRFASMLPVGSIAALGYALLLMQTPLGIFGVSIANAYFPDLSELALNIDQSPFLKRLRDAFSVISMLAIPASLGLVLIGKDLVCFLFQHSQFTQANTQITAQVLSAYALGLLPFSLIHILNRSLYAMKDTRTTLFIGVIMIFINYICDYVLVNTWGLNGLALATSVVAWIYFLLLCIALIRKCHQSFWNSELTREMLKIFISSLMMVFFAHYGKIFFLKTLPFSPSLLWKGVIGVKIEALRNIILIMGIALPGYYVMGYFLNLKGFFTLKLKK